MTKAPPEGGFGRKLEGYVVPINCENSGARCVPATYEERRAVAGLVEGGTFFNASIFWPPILHSILVIFTLFFSLTLQNSHSMQHRISISYFTPLGSNIIVRLVYLHVSMYLCMYACAVLLLFAAHYLPRPSQAPSAWRTAMGVPPVASRPQICPSSTFSHTSVPRSALSAVCFCTST